MGVKHPLGTCQKIMKDTEKQGREQAGKRPGIARGKTEEETEKPVKI